MRKERLEDTVSVRAYNSLARGQEVVFVDDKGNEYTLTRNHTINTLEKDLIVRGWLKNYIGLWVNDDYPKVFVDTNTNIGTLVYEGYPIRYSNSINELLD